MKNRIPRFFYFICLCIPILLAGQDNPNDKHGLEVLRKLNLTRPLLGEAFDLLAIRDWEGAGRKFNRCLEALPEIPDACFGCGLYRQ